MIYRTGQTSPLYAPSGGAMDNVSQLTTRPLATGKATYYGNPVNAAVASNASAPNVIPYLVGLVVLLIVLKYASEHEKARMEPRFMGIGAWNFIAAGLMALLFIVAAKAGINKWQNQSPFANGLRTIINSA